jgi:hypothetical protein
MRVYRYWTPTDTNYSTLGYLGGLKYIFNPQDYSRAMAAGVDPTSASDAAVAPFASNYFEYDSGHRVTKEVAQGAGCSCSGASGQGTFTYAYTTSTNTSDYNNWTYKTVETLLDDTSSTLYTDTLYANFFGETMLSSFKDVSDAADATLDNTTWNTYWKFDTAGRTIQMAAPSAVASFSESSAISASRSIQARA